MKTNNTGHVDVSQLVRLVGSADRNKVGYFSKPVGNDPNGIMPSVGVGQASNKVHTDFIPFPLGNLEGLKQSSQSLVLSLDPLTNVTVLDERHDLSLHAMPPELLPEVLIHFGSSRVNGVEGLVCLLHDELF